MTERERFLLNFAGYLCSFAIGGLCGLIAHGDLAPTYAWMILVPYTLRLFVARYLENESQVVRR